MEKASSVTTVDRLVRVLDSFSPERSAYTLSELSARLDLPKSTLHRFLVSLETHGILRRNPDDKLWRLGYRLFVWGLLAEEATGLSHLARPLMQEIADSTGEMVALTVYSGHEVLCVDKIDTHHSVRLALEVGSRRPAHAGASSKVLLAYQTEAEIEAVVKERGLPKLCKNTITDPAELADELARIRTQGYALSIEETDVGAWGVATPIWERSGIVVAAIGVAGPSLRFSEELIERYVAECRQACQAVTKLLRGTD
jgi:DNA-binding IclR family transcriptional regulator